MHLSRADCDRLGIDFATGQLVGGTTAPDRLRPGKEVNHRRSSAESRAAHESKGHDLTGAAHPSSHADVNPMALVLAGHPPTVNHLTRGKLKARIKLGKRWRAAVGEAWRGPRAAGKRRVRLTIVLGPKQKGADVDAYGKATLDALVLCMALRDDSKEWAEIAPVEYVRGPRALTRIVLEEM